MNKKVLALLLAVLMLITLMVGCTRTEEFYVSISDENSGIADDSANDDADTDGDKADDDQNGSASTKRTKTTTGKTQKTTAVTGVVTRTRPQGDKMLRYEAVADASADYTVKGKVSIAVDTVRPTDYAAMFDVLMTLYPNVEFSFDYWAHSSSDTAIEYLTKTMATGTSADIIWDEAGNLPTYIRQNWIYPITDLVAKDSEAKNIPSNLKSDYTYFGELYAVPHQATFQTMAFNLDLMNKLGLKMPGLEWSLDQMEEYLKTASVGFDRGWCVGIEDLFEVDDLATYYYANASGSGANYGDHAYNYKTRQIDIQYMQRALKLFRAWRLLGNGAEGWYASTQKSGDTSLLTQQLGISDYTTAFQSGKALLEYTLTAWVDRGDLGTNLPFNWVQWTTPNKDGNLMMHIDCCFITTNIDKENLDAAFQALRFMTYSTNGNLARLTMYEDSQKGKYVLNSPIFYPTSTSKAVIDKFKKLSVTDEVDEYLLNNIPNSRRFDTFKLIPNDVSIQSELQQYINNITDGLDADAANIVEPAVKTNQKLAQSWKDFEADVKKVQAKYK